MENKVLEVKNVSKSYDNYLALNNVSLSINQGTIFGLLGPNGAGKTSLIRIINQITMPDSGTILFNGKPLSQSHIKQIGYLPEERGLYKSMKVGEQVLYLARLKGIEKSEAKTKIDFWFKKFGIESWWNKKIEELSKGMAQKIQFIVTVLHEPKLLIFDEPFSGFDPINAEIIKNEILLLKEKGATIIFSTHRMESVEELCDDIALMNKSNLILNGNLSAVKESFKQNIFEVKLKIFEEHKSIEAIHKKIDIIENIFDPIKNINSFKIQLAQGKTANDLLSELSKAGSIILFKELIPSVNDIFIHAVKMDSYAIA
ncbi:MAG: ABC transporter ATP-binding protein [Flavobacteriales bacterium CG_4_9_14_3_um_filter_40_17]|nr:MAG: ABC transporter ATP-binding protein [Flavobacteriales bacterium CG_4_9_14_3_um_filter_40_17]